MNKLVRNLGELLKELPYHRQWTVWQVHLTINVEADYYRHQPHPIKMDLDILIS